MTTLRDPEGIQIVAPLTLISENGCKNLEDISLVILTPSYIIETTDNARYYFRLIKWDFNLMIKTNKNNGYYIVEKCVRNPEKEEIAELLSNGRLIPFSS